MSIVPLLLLAQNKLLIETSVSALQNTHRSHSHTMPPLGLLIVDNQINRYYVGE